MILVLYSLGVILGLLSLAGAGFYLLAALLTLHFFSRARPQPLDPAPAISLLVPVCGLDAGAWQNWSSLCQQDYPDYEVIFGVQDLNDPALPVLKELCQTFPERARWYFCGEIRGINRKMSNLSQLLPHARHNIIVLADSDVRVTPSYLSHITAPFADPTIGVVTCGYVDHAPKRLGAAFLAMGRCIDFIPSVLIARWLDKGLRFAIGPTVVLRRQVIEEIGGLEITLNRVGDDYRLGYTAWQVGYRVELSTYVLDNDCSDESFLKAVQRELRWCRTIRSNRGKQYFGMVFTFGAVYSAVLWALLPNPWTLTLFVAVQGIRWLQAIVSMLLMGTPRLLLWLWLLPLRDVMNSVIWLLGCFGNRIYWRGRWLQVHSHGQLQEIVKNSQSK